VLNGDRILEPAIIEDVCSALEEGADTVVSVTRADDPGEYGVVDTDGHTVTALTEKPGSEETPREVINAGVYGFQTTIFDAIRDTDTDDSGETPITATLDPLIDDGRVQAVRYQGLWVDVSHLWDVPRVSASVLDRRGGHDDGVREEGSVVADTTYVGQDARIGASTAVRRGTSIGDNATVGANAVLTNSVVLADAVVADGAVLRDTVVAENAHVGPNVTVTGGPADVVVEGELHEDVPLGAVVGDNAHVGGGATLAPGTVVGDGAYVEDGAVVSGHVPPGAEVRRG
jgi:NDP-sugar pyrophosphorylase family protein